MYMICNPVMALAALLTSQHSNLMDETMGVGKKSKWVAGLAAWLLCVAPSLAADPSERADQIRKAVEQLSDPDPLLRLANMEALVKSGDATLRQYVLRAAVAGDDANLRALALRAYLATTKQLTFQIELPAILQKEYEQASVSAERLREFSIKNYMAGLVAQTGFRFSLAIVESDMSSGSGRWHEPGAYDKFPFVVSGDRLTSTVGLALGGNLRRCIIDFRPSRDLKLNGLLTCQSSSPTPAMKITSPMF